jgi:hypothetical protein
MGIVPMQLLPLSRGRKEITLNDSSDGLPQQLFQRQRELAWLSSLCLAIYIEFLSPAPG